MMNRTDAVLEKYHARAQSGGDFTQLERELYECIVSNLVELVQREEQLHKMKDELVRLRRGE